MRRVGNLQTRETSRARSPNPAPASPISTFSSNGSYEDLVSPRSSVLRDALAGKGRQYSRPATATSRRRSIAVQPDEWQLATDMDADRPHSSCSRPSRPRGLSESRATKPALPQATPTGAKETAKVIGKLQNEKFDLQLKITMMEDRLGKLQEKLDKQQSEVEKADEMKEKYARLKEERNDFRERTMKAEEELQLLRGERAQADETYEALIKERDAAVDEAADMINGLKNRNSWLEERVTMPFIDGHEDFDHFHHGRMPSTPPPRGHKRMDSRPSTSQTHHDSDYYSASSSSSPPQPGTQQHRPLSRRTRRLDTSNRGSVGSIAVSSMPSTFSPSPSSSSSISHFPIGTPLRNQGSRESNHTGSSHAAALSQSKLLHHRLDRASSQDLRHAAAFTNSNESLASSIRSSHGLALRTKRLPRPLEMLAGQCESKTPPRMGHLIQFSSPPEPPHPSFYMAKERNTPTPSVSHQSQTAPIPPPSPSTVSTDLPVPSVIDDDGSSVFTEMPSPTESHSPTETESTFAQSTWRPPDYPRLRNDIGQNYFFNN